MPIALIGWLVTSLSTGGDDTGSASVETGIAKSTLYEYLRHRGVPIGGRQRSVALSS